MSSLVKIRSFYDVLGVTREATTEQINAAFRRLALGLHPDVNKRPTAEKEFQDLNEAFETLKNPLARSEYDATQRRREADLAGPDEVDNALTAFDIEVATVPKKKKKKKKPVVKHDPRLGTAEIDAIPDGFGADHSLGGVL